MPAPFRDEHDSYIDKYLETSKKRIIGIGREVRGLRQNGKTFPLHLSVSEGYIDHRRVFTAFLRDLGRLREAEERVRQSEQLAELSTISAGIAHDVGTPMTTILGYAELLQKNVTTPKNRERAGHIVDQVRRVKDLLRTLLDIARPRNARPQSMSLVDILDHSLGFFREKLKGRGIVVERDYSSVPKIVANRDRLEQVFLNLIVNAIDAMPDGGTLTVHLTQPTSELIEICIADTGIGIEPDVLDQIFEPFYTTKERGKGTGLGLLVSQRIIHDHGGKISAESEFGVGTQISILLPSGEQATSSEL
jgi:signal transduction histidine kinase